MKTTTKVLIDISHATDLKIRGIGVYEKNIISTDFNLDALFLGVSKRPEWLPKKAIYIQIPNKFIPLREQLWVPYYIYKHNIKSLHVFGNVAPILLLFNKTVKVYLTVHDVSFTYSKRYLFSKNFKGNIKNFLSLVYQRLFISYSLKKAFRINTVSKWPSNEIKKYAKKKKLIINNEINIIPNKCSQIFYEKPIPLWSEKNEKILIVAGSHPQKNLLFTFNALNKLPSQIINSFEINVAGVEENYIHSKIFKFKINFLSNIPNEKLIKYYDSSKLLIMPSLYESFSIPLIEAKQRKIWILSSNGGAAMEIAPNNSVFFNPFDEDDFIVKFYSIIGKLSKSPSYKSDKLISPNYWKLNS